MHRALLLLLTVLVTALPAGDVESFALADGSKINGRVMSATGSEVTLMTDFGVLRLGLDKLTPESRAKVTEAAKPDGRVTNIQWKSTAGG